MQPPVPHDHHSGPAASRATAGRGPESHHVREELANALTHGLGAAAALAGVVLVAMTLGLFGPLFGMPEWLTNLSPVAVAPKVEGDDVDLAGLWWLLLATGIGAALSLGLMRRREPTPAG